MQSPKSASCDGDVPRSLKKECFMELVHLVLHAILAFIVVRWLVIRMLSQAEKPAPPEPAYRKTVAFRRMQNRGNWIVKYMKRHLREKEEFASYHVFSNDEYRGDPVHPNETPVYYMHIWSQDFYSPYSDHLASVWYDAFKREIIFRWCDNPAHPEHREVVEDDGDNYRHAAARFMREFMTEEFYRRNSRRTA